MRKELALSRGQAHGVNADGRRSAADWVERCIDGRVLEAVRERGQQVFHHSSCCSPACVPLSTLSI